MSRFEDSGTIPRRSGSSSGDELLFSFLQPPRGVGESLGEVRAFGVGMGGEDPLVRLA